MLGWLGSPDVGPCDQQYVGMARISNHVRQQVPQGGVVETAAPLRTHSTKIAL